MRIRIRKGSVFVGLLTLDPDPYSEYGSGSGSTCSILPDIFFKKSNFLTKIHIFKLKFFSYEKKTKFLSVKDGENTKKMVLKIPKNCTEKITLKIRIRIQKNLRMLDPDPYIMYTDPQP